MPRPVRPAAARRFAIQAFVVCLVALAAAVVAFSQGSWLGIVWVLLAALTSNLAWYYHRWSRADSGNGPARGPVLRRRAAPREPGESDRESASP